jgi:hypothetical protein
MPLPATQLFFQPPPRVTLQSRRRTAEGQLAQAALDRPGKFALAALRRVNADVRGSVALIEQNWPQSGREGMLLGQVCLDVGECHQIPHAHPSGWLRGVYYLAVPDAIVGSSRPAGCPQFSLPGGASAPGQAIDGPIIRLQPGLFVTCPANARHGTYPYPPAPGDAAPRVVVAFDLEPRADG